MSEILTYDVDSNEFRELSREIAANHQRIENFKIRPGHRNLILNLLNEVEKTDFSELSGQFQTSTSSNNNVINVTHQEIKHEEQQPVENEDYMFVSMSEDDEQQIDQQTIVMTEDDVIVEDDNLLEEYLVEQDDGVEEDYVEVEIDDLNMLEKKRSRPSEYVSASGRVQKKYKPEHMYNEEFLSSNVGRRKKLYNKHRYPDTDEGIRERFSDMLQQSLEIILTKEVYEKCRDVELEVKKVRENSWTAQCPICRYLIKLPIVLENGGRYKNYKRSNFERHIRFKHCPGGKHYESPNNFGF